MPTAFLAWWARTTRFARRNFAHPTIPLTKKAAGIAADGLRSLKREAYFGYLNSGAAFSASLVVFMVATHLLFFSSYLTLTEAGDTAT